MTAEGTAFGAMLVATNGERGSQRFEFHGGVWNYSGILIFISPCSINGIFISYECYPGRRHALNKISTRYTPVYLGTVSSDRPMYQLVRY